MWWPPAVNEDGAGSLRCMWWYTMRRPRALAGLVMLSPAMLLLACSDRPVPTEASRAALPTSALARQAKHVGSIIGHDACDPASFNAMFGDGTCINPGPTTLDEFFAELTETQNARGWAEVQR